VIQRLKYNQNTPGVDEIDFSRMHEECRIDLEQVYERPPLAVSIGSDVQGYPIPFATYGNISLIKGEEKSRKSFVKSLILSCAIGGNSINFAEEIKGHNLGDKYILDLDGEQDEYYAWLNGIRIPKMVGALPDNFQTIKLREKSVKERNEYLEWLFMESQFRNKIGLVSIDGYVDFVKNFNDLEECNQFTQRLMKYSSVTKCHITGILHLNPGTTKARGHLGTILQQKCESVINIQDGGEYSIVECQRARGKKFQDFTLRVDKDWLPYVSEDPVNNSTNAKDPF
jgi:hypothetical protein